VLSTEERGTEMKKILVIDIGNSSTTFGVFHGKKLRSRWVVKTLKLGEYNLKSYANYDVIVSSVVPSIDKVLKTKLSQSVFVKASDFDKSMRIRIRRKGEVGADRAVNAYAAREIYGKPAIVIDFGTATTFDIVSGKGEYLGGAIVSGIQMTCDALSEKTAKLPHITIKPPKNLIGDSTVEAMRSGILYGYVSLVEGMIARFKKKIGSKAIVVATGGYSKLIAKYAKGIDVVDVDLILKGLVGFWFWEGLR